VSTYRGSDVQVRISGKRLDRIRFRPLTGRPRYLIVGIDPGTTTAVAALDLDGNLLHLSSSRQMNMSGVIESLYKAGKPLIIASDVQEMPFSVEKIRRAFSAIAHSPKQDMSVDSKMELTASFAYSNDHERDALSAALDAYRQYRNKFQNLAKRVPSGHDLDEVRARVIRGQALEQVLGDLRVREAVPEAAEPAVPVEGKRDERVRVLDGMVKRLRTFVAELQEEVKERNYEIQRLQSRLRRFHTARDAELAKDADIARRDAIIQSLKKRFRKEERHNKSLKKRLERKKQSEEIAQEGDAVPLKVLEALTKDGLFQLTGEAGIEEGDVIYVTRTDGWGRSVVKDLADAGVVAVIVSAHALAAGDPQMPPSFRELCLPLLSAVETRAQVKGKIGLVPKEALDAALARWKGEQEQREREKKSAMVEHIFKEYKSERGKEVRKGG
jgi:predicted RNase H-like nuclease (RuvC/YqgF family)